MNCRTSAPRALFIAAAALLSLSGPAWAEETPSTTDQVATTQASKATCADPLIENPFAKFGDARDYVLAPGASFESSPLTGWKLSHGASVVKGNEPFYVHGKGDTKSLQLLGKAWAVSPMMCVDLHYPTMRFTASQHWLGNASLEVDVLYPEAAKPVWKKVGKIDGRSRDGWKITRDVEIRPELGGALPGARQVALRFWSNDVAATWRIDDVYVDPKRR